jgi:tetratricopeptide (TPR) repeat protein
MLYRVYDNIYYYVVPTKDEKKSKKYFEKALELNNMDIFNTLPNTTFNVDNVKILKKAIKNDRKLYCRLAQYYGDKGDMKKKEKYLKKLLKIKITNMDFWTFSNLYHSLYEINNKKKKYFEKSGKYLKLIINNHNK